MEVNKLQQEVMAQATQSRKPWKSNPRLTVLLDINSTASGTFTFLGESDSFHS